MIKRYKFEIDLGRQENLEKRIELIIKKVQKIDEKTVEEKTKSDELTLSDVKTFEIIKNTASKDVYGITEEGRYGNKSDTIEVWDPIDGSSEFNRIGIKKSPLTTAGIVIYDNMIIGASIGDIWNEKIYGLDKK